MQIPLWFSQKYDLSGTGIILSMPVPPADISTGLAIPFAEAGFSIQLKSIRDNIMSKRTSSGRRGRLSPFEKKYLMSLGDSTRILNSTWKKLTSAGEH